MVNFLTPIVRPLTVVSSSTIQNLSKDASQSLPRVHAVLSIGYVLINFLPYLP